MPDFQGNLFNDAGTAVNAANVAIFTRATAADETTSSALATATTTTNSAGLWTSNGVAEGTYDVRITSSGSVRWRRYQESVQYTTAEVANFRLRNPAGTFIYDFVPGAITANRTVNIPVLPAADTLAVLAMAQTFVTGVKTFNSSILAVRNPADTFSYTFVASAITAARNLTIPLTTADDTFAVLGLAQTFTAAITCSAAGTAFTVTNTARLGTVVTDAGLVGTPSHTTTGDLDTGMFFPLANTLALATGGVQNLRIASSGNVGVGYTADAAEKLTVSGTIAIGVNSGIAGANNVLAIASSTAPTGNPADTVVLFAVDIAGSHELRVRDEAGNLTTLSPHAWTLFQPKPDYRLPFTYHSERDGWEINVDMFGAIRALERLVGEQFIYLRNPGGQLVRA